MSAVHVDDPVAGDVPQPQMERHGRVVQIFGGQVIQPLALPPQVESTQCLFGGWRKRNLEFVPKK